MTARWILQETVKFSWIVRFEVKSPHLAAVWMTSLLHPSTNLLGWSIEICTVNAMAIILPPHVSFCNHYNNYKVISTPVTNKKNNAHISISYIANKNWNHPRVPNVCGAFGKENNGPRSKHGPRSSVYLGEAEKGRVTSGTMGIQGAGHATNKKGPGWRAKGWGGDRFFLVLYAK